MPDPEHVSQKTPRSSIVEGNIAKIPLGVGAKHGYAIVDADFRWLDKYNWCKQAIGYAASRTGGKYTQMHHLILPRKKGFETDHMNNNRVDNRLANLRYATRTENRANSLMPSTNTSGHKGVYYAKDRGLWRTRIKGVQKYFDTKEEAALDYNERAYEAYGEFAKLNKVDIPLELSITVNEIIDWIHRWHEQR